jgi:DNA modification methylase
MTKNRLYCGDNLEILPTMEGESVDLIYIDLAFIGEEVPQDNY